MVVQTERRVLVRQLQRFVEENEYMINYKATRRSYLNLCTMVRTLEDNRYLKRSFCGPTTYFAVSDTEILELLTPLNYRGFRECFRLSRDELRVLYDQVGDHPIFHNSRGRRQRHPIIQLSVFLFRLGTANRLSDIARALGGLSVGTVINYTDRSLIALNSIYRREVAWPSPERRKEMHLWHYDNDLLPGCIGYIDGSHVILRKCPSFEPEKNTSFFTRKKRYALLILVVCDEEKRFTYLQVGHYGSAHDTRAQKETTIHTAPERLFDHNQYVLADSGFIPTRYVVPLYKRKPHSQLEPDQADFNEHAARIRVRIEHAIGVLKQRFRMLSDMNLKLKTDGHLRLARLIVRSAVILHNMFIKTSDEYWSLRRFNEAKLAAENDEALQIDAEADGTNDEPNYSAIQHDRRKRLTEVVNTLIEARGL